jgi:hypothetical protein
MTFQFAFLMIFVGVLLAGGVALIVDAARRLLGGLK